MRLEVINCGGLKIINDAYNASPASTRAALQTLVDFALEGRKIAVLGNMLELGPRALEGHREVGETAAGLNLDCLVTVGNLAAAIYDGAIGAGYPPEKAFQCADNSEAAVVLEKLLQSGDVVLVKGSRGMKMEQIVGQLIKYRDDFK
jgi:UDP-N-acetylmuramoyl-tripeptide--D-alanyl-D-alanine ligase